MKQYERAANATGAAIDEAMRTLDRASKVLSRAKRASRGLGEIEITGHIDSAIRKVGSAWDDLVDAASEVEDFM